MKNYTIYLSGEIHSNWIKQIIDGCEKRNLPIEFYSPVTDHDASDAAGDVLDPKSQSGFWRDHKSAKVNMMRIQTLIKASDLAIIRFGDKYKPWNAAFDAGYCAGIGKPYITFHDEEIIHPLKEVDSAAMAWASNPDQVVEILNYIIKK